MAARHRRVVLDVTDVVASERDVPLATRISGAATMAEFINSANGATVPIGKSQTTIEVDVERYQDLLDSTDLTPAQRQDVIQGVWTIVAVAMDLGLKVDPAQISNRKARTMP
jgi:hypothetical protein